MRQAVFTVGDNQYAYIGHTKGERWKLYDVPYFEKDVATKIVDEYNECAEYPIIYDSIYNNFYIYDEGNHDYIIYKGKEFKTAGGIKILYGIGAWDWQWEEFTERDTDCLAEGIVDWLWEFNTYEYRDQYDDRADLLKEIKIQLKELETLAEAIKIYYSDILSAEEIFNALSKLLTV